MATFTFIVEDGSIVADANSYASLADADSILEIDARQYPLWTGLAADADREKQLALATAYLEDNYQWFGYRTGPTLTPAVVQPLKWPRTDMRDAEGICIGNLVIPRELIKATVLLAVWLISNDGTDALNAEQIKRFRSDEVEIEFQDGQSARLAPAFLSKLLRCFGYGPGDRGFKDILRR